jgi:hypothetical protein
MQTVRKLHTEFEGHTKTVGRTIKTTKTNIMIQSRKDLSCKQMGIQNTAAAESFIYPGTINNRKYTGSRNEPENWCQETRYNYPYYPPYNHR